MVHRAWLMGWLIPCLLLPAPPGTAAQEKEPHRSILVGVNGLQKPVTCSETKIPLAELMEKVAADIGVPLAASAEVADEPIAVVVKQMPARELLDELAELLDYRWRREGGEGARRYVIYQDIAGRQREEALREAQRAEVEKRFQEDLKHLVEMSSLTQAQIQEIIDDNQRRYQAPAARKLSTAEAQSSHDSQDEMDRSRRTNLAYQLYSSTSRALAHLLGRLSPQQGAVLRREGRITLSTDPRPGELPLPEWAVQSFRSSQPRMLPPNPANITSPDALERMRKFETKQQEEWAAASGYRVTVQYTGPRPEAPASFFLGADITTIRTGAPSSGSVEYHQSGASLRVNAEAEPFNQQAAEDTPARRAALAADPVLSVRKEFTLKVTPRPEHLARAKGPLRFQELLPDVARTYGIQIISDSYWTDPPSQRPVTGGEPMALYALLDARTGRHQQWDHRGNLVRLRSRTWFLDRPREVPLRLIRRWKTMADAQGALPFEEYVEMARLLNDGQLSSLEIMVNDGVMPAFMHDISQVVPARHALRLYGSLTPGQQRGLWSGIPVPLEQMSPLQQALYAAGLKEDRFGTPAPPSLVDCAEGRFKLGHSAVVRTVTVSDGGLSVQSNTGPATQAEANEVPPSVRSVPKAGPNRAAQRPRAFVGGPDGVSRHELTSVGFTFECAPDKQASAGVIVAPSP